LNSTDVGAQRKDPARDVQKAVEGVVARLDMGGTVTSTNPTLGILTTLSQGSTAFEYCPPYPSPYYATDRIGCALNVGGKKVLMMDTVGNHPPVHKMGVRKLFYR
jgi:hypothetical protein